jgi:hypothetical protein
MPQVVTARKIVSEQEEKSRLTFLLLLQGRNRKKD